MRRRAKSRDPRQADQQVHIRHAVAVEAARLLYRRDFKEYYQAKREAARRNGCKVLPTNAEIHHQLILIAQATEGGVRTERLQAMREAALQVMERLESFRPRLIGSVWTGHIRKGSDIDLHLYADELEQVTDVLDGHGMDYEVSFVRSQREGEIVDFTHIHVLQESELEVEITLYPLEEYYHHPKCSITGGPMARGSLADLRILIDKEHGQQATVCRSADFTALRELLARPLRPLKLCNALPELERCAGVAQNHYHHLDVLDHTLEVVRNVELIQTQEYSTWPAQASDLTEHFAEETSCHWDRRELLTMGALCHDIGKPDTQHFHRSGRIQFLGHEKVSGRLTRRIGERLGIGANAVETLARLVELHMVAIMLPVSSPANSELYRFFQEAGDLLPELLLLSYADLSAARGPAQSEYRMHEQKLFVKEMLEEYFQRGLLRYPNLPVSEVDLELELGVYSDKTIPRLREQLIREYLDGEFRGREDGLVRASELLEMPAELWP